MKNDQIIKGLDRIAAAMRVLEGEATTEAGADRMQELERTARAAKAALTPRVLAPEELSLIDGAVYLERRGEETVKPALYRATFDKQGGGEMVLMADTGLERMRVEACGIEWRPWSRRPGLIERVSKAWSREARPTEGVIDELDD